MRALVMTNFGEPVTIAQIPTPRITCPSQVLVRVLAASLTRSDPSIVAGEFQGYLEHLFPITLGREFGGVIEQVGTEVDGFAVGDEVIGMLDDIALHDGTIAEYVVSGTGPRLAHLPSNLEFLGGATLPMAALAAMCLVDSVDPTPADRVLVVGASGGIGSFTVQLAAQRGAYVIATGHPDDEPYLRSLGAADVVDYRHDVHAALRRQQPGGVNALIDLVSHGPALARLCDHLTPGGRVSSTNIAADILTLTERGLTATNIMADLAPGDTLQRVVALVEAGALRTPAIRAFEFDAAESAIAAMQQTHTRGKYVIRFPNPRPSAVDPL